MGKRVRRRRGRGRDGKAARAARRAVHAGDVEAAEVVGFLEAVRDSAEQDAEVREAAGYLLESGWPAGAAAEFERFLEHVLLGALMPMAVLLLSDAQRAVKESRVSGVTAMELLLFWSKAGRIVDDVVLGITEPFGLVPRTGERGLLELGSLAGSVDAWGGATFIDLRRYLQDHGWTEQLDAELLAFNHRVREDPDGLGSFFGKVIGRALKVARGFERKLAPEVLLLIAAVGVKAFEEWRPWALELSGQDERRAPASGLVGGEDTG